MNHNVGDCPVLAPEFGRVIVNFFTAHQLVPEFVERRRVYKKLREAMADIFLGRVSEKFQHSLIRPHNFLICSRALHAL